MDPQRRYWVHGVWVVQLLCGHTVLWWSFWSYREVEAWSIGSFSLLLLGPAVMYAASNALVTSAPSSVESWRHHFLEVRGWFFGLLVLLLAQLVAREWVVLGVSPLHPSRLGVLISLLVLVLGARSGSARIQAGIAIFGLLGVLAMGALRAQPGSVALP